jgi:hypothetical protein
MIDAMKQALEALDKTYWSDGVLCSKAFNALRQAIEQAEKQEKLCKYCGGIGRVVCDGRCMPEQEPVAWMRNDGTLLFADGNVFAVGQAFYTAPPKREWVGLDVDDIDSIQIKVLGGGLGIELTNFVRAIEAKLRERNT